MRHCKEQRAGLGLWYRDPLFVHPSWFGLMARKRLKKQNCCKVSKNYLSIPLEGRRKALKNMPSEHKIFQNGRIGGEDGDGQKTEEAMLLPEKNKNGPIQGLKRQCKRNTRCVVVAFMLFKVLMRHCKEQRAGLGLWYRDPLYLAIPHGLVSIRVFNSAV
ncbi:hypothetical protein Tco_0277619 [Tanacetum coccineum]